MNSRYSTLIRSAFPVVLIASFVLLVPWLGETLFYSKGEPREAIVGVSILEGGNWILPTNYGGDIPYKPPFLGWLIAIFAAIFNGGVVSEFISRLPSALAAIAMICGGYFWAKRAKGERFALIFSVITLCSFEVFRAALACRLDMVLTACMVGALYTMYAAEEHNRGSRRALLYLLAWVLMSCACLTKGPVGSFLTCFIFGVYLLLRRRNFFASLFKMLVLAAVATLPMIWWGYEAYQQGGEHFYNLMMEENFDRLFSRMAYESHVQPFWYNFVTLAAGLLPWTVFLLAACFGRKKSFSTALSPAALLSVCAAVLTVVFYTIPDSKRSVYLLPAYPFICYGITCVFESASAAGARRFFAWFISILAILAPVALIATQFVDIKGLSAGTIPWWGYIILLIPFACGVAWIVNRHSPLGHTLVTVWSMFLAYVAVGMPLFLNPKSDSVALERICAGNPPAVINLLPDEKFRLYSLNYYLNDKLRHVATVEEAAAYPRGTVLLIPSGSDTTGISDYYTVEPLLPRSADHRNKVDIAFRK
ncbi:MAG: hypothetical protein HDS65_05610 [Bacteroidales bacterium]|nr:hypothetical protein [Bacteroidales bacterium]